MMDEPPTTILFCRCAFADVMPAATRDALANTLVGRDGITVVDDLCGCMADRDPRAATWANAGRLIVVACHVRVVNWLFRWAGAPLEASRVTFLDMRRQSAAEILSALGLAPAAGAGSPSVSGSPVVSVPADGWVPWFPVIDTKRCRQCRQCLSFCLFGVYTLSETGKVEVTNPRHCKNRCPACARICPEIAIMFPKLPAAESPLNGDEISDEPALKERVRVNVQSMLGDDVYTALAARRREARKRLLRQPAAEQALRERAAHSPEEKLSSETNSGTT